MISLKIGSDGLPNIEGHSSMTIHSAREEDYDEITQVWEDSVRATHDFVSQEDIEQFRPLVRNELLPQAEVVYTRDAEGRISGFAGVVGDKIEMIFIAPRHFGKKLGKLLFWHAVCEMGATRLDVNESNEKAVNFYLRQGCTVIGRSPLDSMGKPYPILHLEWKKSE